MPPGGNPESGAARLKRCTQARTESDRMTAGFRQGPVLFCFPAEKWQGCHLFERKRAKGK
uniref:Uncharacterized protein n=1 Tax=Faecalibaculum rodentium TaxID=1702221 RepID=A0A140DRP0_9FIRM|nr:hypothetical protein AALO17_01830 [Faecalibaculum rodentium]